MSKKLFFVHLLALLLMFSLTTNAWAYTISLDIAFSNWDPPLISTFGTIEITDLGDNVQFEIGGLASGAGGSGSDLQWFYFNTTSDISGLSLYSSTEPASLDYSFNNSDTLYKPDGDGFFDGRLDFGDGTPQVSDVIFQLSASTALGIDDFLAFSVGGNKGAYMFAAHIQSTDTPFTSEFVGAVPEPASMLLLGSGLLGLGAVRRKFRRKQSNPTT